MDYRKKTVTQLKKILQKHFNKFIRERDSQDGWFKCISCGQIKSTAQLQAGHFYPGGQVQSLRYNEVNVNGECIQCNYYGGDHLIKYKDNLIAKWGIKEFKKLEMAAGIEKNLGFHKWDRFTLIDKIETYKNKCREI